MDIFLSYNWNIKKQVKSLYDKLTELNYKVWMDDEKLNAGNNALTAELANGIKTSKLFLSCVTQDYCKSYNCNLEVEFASQSKKEMIILMVDKLDTTSIHEIQIVDRDQKSGIGLLITYKYKLLIFACFLFYFWFGLIFPLKKSLSSYKLL